MAEQNNTVDAADQVEEANCSGAIAESADAAVDTAAIEGEQLLAELIGSARARASLYRLVSLFFATKPEGPLVESLAQSINANAPIESALMAEGFRQMAEYLEPQRTNATLLDLIVDYSLSVDKVELAEGSAIGAPKDQVGATCESLCTLCARQAELLEEGDLAEGLKMLQIQDRLYSDRVPQLMNAFCDVIDEKAVTLFYQGASKIARGFAKEERMFIDDSIAAVQELIDARSEGQA